jgi:hypothetical protein
VRGDEKRGERVRFGDLVEVAGGRIPARVISPATSMETALASCRQAAASSQIQRGIDRRVASAAARPNGTGRCERGWEDRAVHAWVEGSKRAERAELGTGSRKIGKERRRVDGEEGGKAGIYSRREKRRGSATRAFPDRAAAKPRGSNRTTEITIIIISTILMYCKYTNLKLIFVFTNVAKRCNK